MRSIDELLGIVRLPLQQYCLFRFVTRHNVTGQIAIGKWRWRTFREATAIQQEWSAKHSANGGDCWIEVNIGTVLHPIIRTAEWLR